jgi:hypothetical protein
MEDELPVIVGPWESVWPHQKSVHDLTGSVPSMSTSTKESGNDIRKRKHQNIAMGHLDTSLLGKGIIRPL